MYKDCNNCGIRVQLWWGVGGCDRFMIATGLDRKQIIPTIIWPDWKEECWRPIGTIPVIKERDEEV